MWILLLDIQALKLSGILPPFPSYRLVVGDLAVKFKALQGRGTLKLKNIIVRMTTQS